MFSPSITIVEPCNTQAGTDFDFILCDDGRVDSKTLKVNERDPKFGDIISALAWGNTLYHGSGCKNKVGSPVDNLPMSYMFAYLLVKIDKHSEKAGQSSLSGYKFTERDVHADIDAVFNMMAPANGYDEAWGNNVRKYFDKVPDMQSIIGLFVRRAITTCIPDCTIDAFGICDDTFSGLIDTLMGALDGQLSKLGDMAKPYESYVGNQGNKLKFDISGCSMIIEGLMRFINAKAVQPDGLGQEAGMLNFGVELMNAGLVQRPSKTADCTKTLHAKWHWRSQGVMRTFLEFAQRVGGAHKVIKWTGK